MNAISYDKKINEEEKLGVHACSPRPENENDPMSVITFLGELAGVCVYRYTKQQCYYCICYRSMPPRRVLENQTSIQGITA